MSCNDSSFSFFFYYFLTSLLFIHGLLFIFPEQFIKERCAGKAEKRRKLGVRTFSGLVVLKLNEKHLNRSYFSNEAI